MHSPEDTPPERSCEVRDVGGTLWHIDGDVEVRLKDLSPEDAHDALSTVCVTPSDAVGQRIVATFATEAPGPWGGEPTTWLILEDGTACGFVHPRDDD